MLPDGFAQAKGWFWRKLPFKARSPSDAFWVDSRHCSDRAANGGFASLLENSCHSATDPIAVVLHLVITLRMKSHPTNIIAAMLEMLLVFESVCKDVDTLQRLIKMASDREKWEDGHSLFQDIRQKTLWAEKHGDPLVKTQYAFEEICAKTLYNLSGCNAPFDADSAFWVVPLGVALGRELGFSEPSQVSTLLEM